MHTSEMRACPTHASLAVRYVATGVPRDVRLHATPIQHTVRSAARDI